MSMQSQIDMLMELGQANGDVARLALTRATGLDMAVRFLVHQLRNVIGEEQFGASADAWIEGMRQFADGTGQAYVHEAVDHMQGLLKDE